MSREMVNIPRPQPIGQERPKGFVEVKKVATSRGTVIQEFLPVKKKKHKTRRG